VRWSSTYLSRWLRWTRETVHLEVDEVQDSGKTTEEVATTATTTAMLITTTGAEDLTGGDTTPRATEVATTIATHSLVTTPQATAIRDMDQGQVAGKLGEAEVILLPVAVVSKPVSVAVIKSKETPVLDTKHSCVQVEEEAEAELQDEVPCNILTLRISSS